MTKTSITPKEMAAVLRDRPHGDLYAVDLRNGSTACKTISGGAAHVAAELERLSDDLVISRIMVLEYAHGGR